MSKPVYNNEAEGEWDSLYEDSVYRNKSHYAHHEEILSLKLEIARLEGILFGYREILGVKDE